MGLLAHIRAESGSAAAHKCKTCAVLEHVTDEDRSDFREAASIVNGAALARALTSRLVELGVPDSVGAGSVRTHIREKHEA